MFAVQEDFVDSTRSNRVDRILSEFNDCRVQRIISIEIYMHKMRMSKLSFLTRTVSETIPKVSLWYTTSAVVRTLKEPSVKYDLKNTYELLFFGKQH